MGLHVILSDIILADITLGGERIALKAGEWSKWVRVKFRINLFITVEGLVQLYLTGADTELQLLPDRRAASRTSESTARTDRSSVRSPAVHPKTGTESARSRTSRG